MGLTISTRNLRYSYGAQPVLEDVTLGDIAPGSCVALVGPNGAGKSTLFRCLAGLLPCDGEVLVDGTSCSRRELRRLQVDRITYLPQEFPVTTALTVFESVLVTAQGRGWRISAGRLGRVEETLERLGLTDLAHRYLNELSGGQRQLVSVAQALVRDPDLLLLDEPVSNLDLHHQLSLLEQVREISRADGITTVVSIHDLNLAARFSDTVLVLNDGRIDVSGTPEDVFTPEMLRAVYRVDADIGRTLDDTPVVMPRRALR